MVVDTDRVVLLGRKESSYGAGVGAAKLSVIPHSSHSLRFTQTRVESDDIDADRQVTSHVLSDQDAGGSINAEYRRGWNDDILEGALQSDWAASVAVATANANVDYTHSTTSFSLASGSWTNMPAVGSWIRVSGFTALKAVLNGVYEVESRTTNEIVVAKGTGTAVGDHAEGDSVTITQLERLTSGSTDESFAFEEQIPQLSNEFEEFLGYVLNSISMNSARSSGDGKVLIEAAFVGGASEKNSATAGDGSPTAKTANRAYSSAGGEGSFTTFDNDVKLLATQVNFSISNGRDPLKNCGELLPEGMGSGKLRATIDWRAYHKQVHQSMEAAIRLGTQRDFAIVMSDAAGNYDIIHFPSVVYQTPEKAQSGKETRRMFAVNGTGEKDATLGFTVQWCRYNVA